MIEFLKNWLFGGIATAIMGVVFHNYVTAWRPTEQYITLWSVIVFVFLILDFVAWGRKPSYHRNKLSDRVMYQRFAGMLVTFVIFIVLLMTNYEYFTAVSQWDGYVDTFRWKQEWDVQRYVGVKNSCEQRWVRACEPEHAYGMTRDHWRDTGRDDCKTTYYTDSDGDRKSRRSCSNIYGNFTDYYTNSWRHTRTLVTSEINQNPYWPDVDGDILSVSGKRWETDTCPTTTTQHGANATRLGCERPTTQRSLWQVRVHPMSDYDGLNDTWCNIGFNKWDNLRLEDSVYGEFLSHQLRIKCETTVYPSVDL